jgi:hypothetical protein
MADTVSLNNKFLVVGNDAANGIEVSLEASANPEARDLLLNNKAPDKEIVLGNIKLHGAAGKDLKFAGKHGEVKFAASGSVFAGLGVYFDAERALATLGLDDDISRIVKLSGDPNSYFSVLRWGYDISGSAKGKIALTQGNITFGFEGKREGLYAVVRRVDKGTRILDAVKQTGESWLLPTQVDSIDDLQPGTWLVAEVDGNIAVSLGAQFGYDFSWVRETSLGALTGDIGLRVQLGLEVALGFKAAGKFALLVGRESRDVNNRTLRLVLTKQRVRGWNMALDAGADVTPIQDVLPAKPDEFISAIFGTYGPQVVEGLGVIEKWTDPEKSLGELFAGVSSKYLQDFLRETTDIDDLINRFDEARQLLLNLIGRWKKLPHTVKTALWKLIDERIDLTELREFVDRLSTIDDAAIKDFLSKQLEKADFFTTPIGRWLSAAAEKGILHVINDQQALNDLRDAATKTRALLDGSEFEAVLTRLQKAITDRLKIDLDKIEEAINAADVKRLDEWLQSRLAAFLDAELKLDRLKEIREALHKLVGKRQEIYEAALKALARTYEFHFSYTYEKTTTKSALFDIEFDYNHAGVAALQADAVDGRFDNLLMTRHEGVKLHSAALSHQIARHSHVEVSLPFFKSVKDHFNTSVANVKATDEGGHVLFYDLTATDKVAAKENARMARISRLTVGGFWKELVTDGAAASTVRLHNENTFSHSYSFKQVKTNMRSDDLRFEFSPLVDLYFRQSFGGGVSGGVGSFGDLIAEMDKRVDKIEFNGPNNFGNTLISFEASLPGRVLAGWLSAPEKKNDPLHREMSLRIQRALKRLIPLAYFSDPRRYDKSDVAGALLLYAAMPPINQFRLENHDTLLVPVDNGEYYWNWPSVEHRNALASHPLTTANLAARFQQVCNLLESKRSELGINPDFYSPGQVERLQKEARKTDSVVAINLRSLIINEFEIVEGTYKATRDIAKFKQSAPKSPSKAIEKLANFGASVTSTFNSKVGDIYGGDHMRPFGSLILLEAACAFDPTFARANPSAMLDITVLRQSVAQPLQFVEDKRPAKEEIVVQQRLVSL